MAVPVDRPKVVVIVGSAVGKGDNVVNLVCFPDAAKLGAVVTPAQILISLQDSLTLAPPWATTTA